MKALSAVLLVAILGLTGYAAPARAFNFKSFVSINGNDGNNCALATP
jgi:hypothetical protein